MKSEFLKQFPFSIPYRLILFIQLIKYVSIVTLRKLYIYIYIWGIKAYIQIFLKTRHLIIT